MKALILCTADPSGDPRPRRMAQWLKGRGARVELLSHPLRDGFPADAHHALPTPRGGVLRKARTLAGMLSPWRRDAIARRFDYQAARMALGPDRYDLAVVEDVYLLPLAFEYAPRVVLDAREYYPRVDEASWRFRAFQKRELVWLCREYLPRCDAVITVSDGLAAAFAREFGAQALVVRSTPDAHNLAPNPVAPEAVRIVHHGIANRDRKLENLLAIAERLDPRHSLDMYLTGDRRYIERLRAAAPARVRVLDPVPYSGIIPTLNQYDIGLFYVEPTTFNLKHCMPNKLFEFIQARLAVAIGPSPDMAALVREHGCGVVAPEFSVDAMAGALNALSADDIHARKRASAAAAAVLNWSVESRKLDGVFR